MPGLIKSTTCLICGSRELTKYLDLGESALANSYLNPEDLKKNSFVEFKAPLEVYFCRSCHLAQLLHIVDRGSIFSEYAYFSSTSPQLLTHFDNYAEEIFSSFPEEARKLTVEIASNDGILLKPLKKRGARVLGIDPAKNIAGKANEDGIDTIPEFFSSKLVPTIVKNYGRAGVILANNVLAHTDVLPDIVLGVSQLLDKNGVFVFEAQYLYDLLKKNEFDNTYHEHICYFSLMPIMQMLEKNGLEAFRVAHVDTQGGSLRVYAGFKPLVFKKDGSIDYFLNLERQQKLGELSTYLEFASRPPLVKDKLKAMLEDFYSQGKKVVGYGAPAKGNTLLQYVGATGDEISYIIDNAPSKQGKLTPGTHIPIVAPEKLKEDVPDYILILAWNYASSIMEREKWFSEQGGKFIIPVPQPHIV